MEIKTTENLTPIETLLQNQRGFVSKYPENGKAVMVISGGLDSIVTSAFLIEEKGMELYPLHIQRGQTNSAAELRSVRFFTEFFQERYGKDKFHDPMSISANVPPQEFKPDLLPYVKRSGHPMRDPIMHLFGVQYAVAVSQKEDADIRTVFCATVPGDPFPHCRIEGMRANTLNACINTGDWGWQVTSPNIDPFLTDKPIGKKEEIVWAMSRGIPIGHTISCYEVGPQTNGRSCGTCASCEKRRAMFREAGFDDPTEYVA